MPGRVATSARTSWDPGDWILGVYVGILALASLLPTALLLVWSIERPNGWVGFAGAVAATIVMGLIANQAYDRCLPLQRWETGTLARALGVPYVSRWLIHGPNLRRLLRSAGSAQLPAASRRTLDEVWERAVLAERVHAARFIAGLPFIVLAFAFDLPRLAVVLIVLNVLVQLYPVLIQRETRRRLTRLRPNGTPRA